MVIDWFEWYWCGKRVVYVQRVGKVCYMSSFGWRWAGYVC